MGINVENYLEILELLDRQEDVIKQQNKIIAKLTNENLEQENMISVIMKEQVG